mgnify:CR=1 FL=1
MNLNLTDLLLLAALAIGAALFWRSQRIRETAAKFAAGDIDPDLFDRAMKPILEYLETSLESNGSWMSVLSRAQSDPESLERFRSRDTSYQNMTLDDVLPVAKQVFDPKSAVEIQILPAL